MFCASIDGTEGIELWFVERGCWVYDLVLQCCVIISEWETELIMRVAAKGIELIGHVGYKSEAKAIRVRY